VIQVAVDAAGFAGACGGIAAIIGATATLVWACRRDPKSGERTIARLPPPAE